MKNATTSAHPLYRFGSWVRLIDGTLFERPMSAIDQSEAGEWYEVTAVEGMGETPERDQAYLDAVNELFDTDFQFSDFAGR